MGYRNSVGKWLEFLRESVEEDSETLEEISGVPIDGSGGPTGPVKDTHTVTVDSRKIGSVTIHIK